MEAFNSFYMDFFTQLRNGKRRECTDLVIDLLEKGTDIKDIYVNIFQKSLVDIGALWQQNKITVADEHLCTAIIQSIMMALYRFITPDKPHNKKAVIACIGNELHEVGARMVSDFFEMDGWDVTYLGANVPTRDILSTITSNNADLLGISCTLTKNVEFVKELISLSRDCKSNIVIAVGGYCFNSNPLLYKYVNADIWSSDAQGTVKLSKELIFKGDSYVING